MVSRIVGILCAVLCVCGCATPARKKAAEQESVVSNQTAVAYQQGQYASEEYDYDDRFSRERFASQPAKSGSAAAAQLSAKQIQRALKAAGFYKGTIDGKIGPQTKAAIRSFQKSHGLKVDGVVGKKTAAALRRYL